MSTTSSAGEWSLKADHITSTGDLLTATGEVTVTHDAHAWRAESASFDANNNRAVLTQGLWELPGGHRVEFGTLALDLDSGDVHLQTARFTDGDGLSVVASAVSTDGQLLRLTDVDATACDCEGVPPWSLRARQATWSPGEWIALQGAQARLFNLPITPRVPTTVPLSRRSGFLTPTLGWAYDGPIIATPLYLTGGPGFDLTVTPEVRPRHGTRLHIDPRYAIRGSDGDYQITVGWDDWEHRFRGSFSGISNWESGPWYWRSDSEWLSDLSYRQDYGDQWLDRSRRWTESRWLLGAHGFELAGRSVQHHREIEQFPLDIAYRQGAKRLHGGLLLDGAVATRLGAITHDLGAPGPWVGDGWMGSSISRPTFIGPLRWTPRLGVEASATAHQDTAVTHRAQATGGVALTVPMWRDTASGFERLEPRLSASATFHTDANDLGGQGAEGQATPLDHLRWEVTPALSWRRTGRHQLIEVVAQVPLSEQGVESQTFAQIELGPWQLQAQLQTHPLPLNRPTPELPVQLATVSSRWDAGTLGGGLRWLLAELRDPVVESLVHIHVVGAHTRWRLPGAGEVITLNASGTLDLLQPVALQSVTAGLRYRHPSGCLTLGAEGTFAVDRALPDLRLIIEVRQSQSKI